MRWEGRRCRFGVSPYLFGKDRDVEGIAAWVFNLKRKAVRDFTINVI